MKTFALIAFVLLFSQPALSADLGVQLVGAEKAAEVASEGGIAGVEAACSESGLYGDGGNCVCSETLDASLSFSGSVNDPSNSPDNYECWGRFASATLSTDASLSTTSVSGGSGWGTQSYALSQAGASVWAMAPQDPITSSTQTYCVKFFRQYDGAMSTDGTCRLKVAQLNYGSTLPQFQAQVKADGGSCTTTAKYHQLTGFGAIDANYNTTVYTNECDDKPCKFELCVDGGVQSGVNIQGRFRVTSYEGAGETSVATTPVFTATGGITLQSFSGGDWWHSGGGSQTMKNAMFSVWAWDTDTDQWPPNTTEIEGP